MTPQNRLLLSAEREYVLLNAQQDCEAALAEDWNRPEEDEAWSHLQQVR